MKVKVQQDGRVTLPKKLRQQAHIREGQWLQITLQDGQVLLHSEETPERGLRLSETDPIWQLVGQRAI